MYGLDCFEMGSKLRYIIPCVKLFFFLFCHAFKQGLWPVHIKWSFCD
jgi:hypothetical protein